MPRQSYLSFGPHLLAGVAAALVALCAAPEPSHAAAPGDIDALIQACDARIEALGRRIHWLTLAFSLLILLGAALSAIGGSLAGFSRQGKHRTIGAMLAIFGALLCLLTTILPDRTRLETQLLAADRQRAAGARFRAELGRGSEDLDVVELDYVAARFSECRAVSPSLELPPPPRAGSHPSVMPMENPEPPEPASLGAADSGSNAPPRREAAPAPSVARKRKRIDLGF